MTALNEGIEKGQQNISSLFTQKITPVETYNGVNIFRDVAPSNVYPIQSKQVAYIIIIVDKPKI